MAKCPDCLGSGINPRRACGACPTCNDCGDMLKHIRTIQRDVRNRNRPFASLFRRFFHAR